MKKIILTIVLSSLLPALAVAKDKTMHNDNPNPSTPSMTGKHMTKERAQNKLNKKTIKTVSLEYK